MLLTTNVIDRVHNIRVGETTATAFTIEVDRRQYLVTARHVYPNARGDVTIHIRLNNDWVPVAVRLVGHGTGEIDISVFGANIQLSAPHPISLGGRGAHYGQELCFLGYPYNLGGDVGEVNRGVPLPFVKRALLSCMGINQQDFPWYLDGNNNPGFSGGPVVFQPLNETNLKIGAVISGYRHAYTPVLQNENALPLNVRYNTGIIIAYSVDNAVVMARANPVGFMLP